MYATYESPRFTEQCEDLTSPDGPIDGGIARLDELRSGISWAVEHDIHVRPEELGTNLRVIKSKEFPGLPLLRVAYSVEEKDGELVAIWEYIQIIDTADADLP